MLILDDFGVQGVLSLERHFRLSLNLLCLRLNVPQRIPDCSDLGVASQIQFNLLLSLGFSSSWVENDDAFTLRGYLVLDLFVFLFEGVNRQSERFHLLVVKI